MHAAEDEELMIRKREGVTEDKGQGLGSGIRRWVNRVVGASQPSLFAVPEHWEKQMDEAAPGDLARLEK